MIRHLSILLATAALASPLTAMAQTAPGAALAPAPAGPAAARLPNTFDRPQAAPTSPAARTAGPAAATPSDPARIAAAEAMLRTTIAAMQAGSPNYGDMTESLAGKVREQSAAITPLIQSFGKMQSLAHVGAENGAELFLVGFDNQITQWIIGQNGEGKIVALLFRPAPPPPA
ncbi:MAG: hypothetical protein ACT6RD_00795 [Brevundimonas sp.]|uniref:hypothetical protein n=1 Tax=Brevundimonas sp. TaxID=1871086 RepID=UPI0040342657